MRFAEPEEALDGFCRPEGRSWNLTSMASEGADACPADSFAFLRASGAVLAGNETISQDRPFRSVEKDVRVATPVLCPGGGVGRIESWAAVVVPRYARVARGRVRSVVEPKGGTTIFEGVFTSATRVRGGVHVSTVTGCDGGLVFEARRGRPPGGIHPERRFVTEAAPRPGSATRGGARRRAEAAVANAPPLIVSVVPRRSAAWRSSWSSRRACTSRPSAPSRRPSARPAWTCRPRP